jgi:hypothetical protein
MAHEAYSQDQKCLILYYFLETLAQRAIYSISQEKSYVSIDAKIQ